MRRLKNYYCWDTIEDWLDAQMKGYVEMREPQQDRIGEYPDYDIKKILKMAEYDCVPMLIICVKDNKGYYIEYNCLIYRFFDFLNNKILLRENGEKILFTDLESEKRTNILNAQIYSLWIDVT